MIEFSEKQWALILGGSSGFGLATAKKLARHGMSVCVVHRDRRGAMSRIGEGFKEIEAHGHGFIALNLDALSDAGRESALDSLGEALGSSGRVRLLMHSIAFGNLKPLAPVPDDRHRSSSIAALAQKLEIDPERLRGELLALGVWGPVAFLAVFAFVQPLGLSGNLLILGGALVWPAPWAFALGLVGATAGQSMGFLFFRYMARDWAQGRMPKRLARYEQALSSTPLRTVFILRLITFTWPPTAALLGVSGIRFVPMLAMTVIGLVPGVALDVWVGAGVIEWIFG